VSLFQSAIDLQFAQLLAMAGVDVVYRREAGAVGLRMVPGKSEQETADAYGSVTRVKLQDFLCRAADLVIGVALTPERGDLIERTIRGKTYTYEVVPDAGDEVFEAPDQDGNRFRIHTKLVKIV
jgi:hypothetical protein